LLRAVDKCLRCGGIAVANLSADFVLEGAELVESSARTATIESRRSRLQRGNKWPLILAIHIRLLNEVNAQLNGLGRRDDAYVESGRARGFSGVKRYKGYSVAA